MLLGVRSRFQGSLAGYCEAGEDCFRAKAGTDLQRV